MPIAPRSIRGLVAACLVAAVLLAVAPGRAAALEPPRPLPNYRPTFVTETDTRPWIDCLWASGAMLLDKWTNGQATATHQKLRKLSGDTSRGSALADLQVAYAKLGIDLAYSPDGGARITWTGLLDRLAHGGGAVLLGSDSQLPRWYGRWDYRFWKGKAKTDNHAVYVERYDRSRGRVWLMDPLARGDWQGEWISIWSLRRFVWSQGGLLYAAMTPKARPAPFARVKVTDLELATTSTTLDATWTLRAPHRWRYPGGDIHATLEAADDPLLAAVTLPDAVSSRSPALAPVHAVAADGADGQADGADAPSDGADAPADGAVATESRGVSGSGGSSDPATESDGARPPKPTATVDDGALRLSAPLPAAPGAYVARLRLSDRRFGRSVADTGEVAMFIPGPRQATVRVGTTQHDAGAGRLVDLTISVRNSGTESWAEPSGDARPSGKAVERNARLLARWIPLTDAEGSPVGDTVVAPDPIVLAAMPLAPGRRVLAEGSVQAPPTTGSWAIVIDIVDDVDGSYAALGSVPGYTIINVVDAPGAFEAPGSTTAFEVLADDKPDGTTGD